jgi:hypothetical protein
MTRSQCAGIGGCFALLLPKFQPRQQDTHKTHSNDANIMVLINVSLSRRRASRAAGAVGATQIRSDATQPRLMRIEGASWI